LIESLTLSEAAQRLQACINAVKLAIIANSIALATVLKAKFTRVALALPPYSSIVVVNVQTVSAQESTLMDSIYRPHCQLLRMSNLCSQLEALFNQLRR
jgi:hypothetical protein